MGISGGFRGSVTQAHSGANTNSVGTNASGGTGGGAELVVTKLGNVRDSPLDSDQASVHRPKVPCFALREAMEMKLSRLELKNYTLDSINDLKGSQLKTLLHRLDKTMKHTSNKTKSCHIVCLLKEMKERADLEKLSFFTIENNELAVNCKDKFNSMIRELELNENRYQDVSAILARHLASKNKKNPFIENKVNPRFTQNCFSGHVSGEELNNLSIDILLEQKQEVLLKFINRVNGTIVATDSFDKSIKLLSLLHQLYERADSYKTAAIAGNVKAAILYDRLENVLHSHLSEGGKSEVQDFLRPKQGAPSNERRESVVSNAHSQYSVTSL